MNIDNVEILAYGQNVWGKGKTIDEALKNMKKMGGSTAYILYLVHCDTYVESVLGDMCYPRKSFQPREIMRKGIKREK